MSQSEIILITGANTGLGFQIAKALYASNKKYDIIIGGRSISKVQDAIKSAENEVSSSHNKLHPLQVDIEHDDSIDKAFAEVKAKFGKLDALVNNAGAQLDQQAANGTLTEREMWIQSWDVNVVGTQIMTRTFVPLLLESSHPRLLFITSGTSTLAGTANMALFVNKSPAKGWPKGNFDGTNYNVPAYRSSKTGLNMMMREWHRSLLNDGVRVWAISPGYLATGLGSDEETNKKMGAGDPAVAGHFVRDVLEGKRDEDVGKIVMQNGLQAW